MGGKIYTPFGAWHHATKFALEAFSDCLRIETSAFGVDVVKAATRRRPRTRYAVGSGAKPLIFMRQLLSDRVFDGLIRRAGGMS